MQRGFFKKERVGRSYRISDVPALVLRLYMNVLLNLLLVLNLHSIGAQREESIPYVAFRANARQDSSSDLSFRSKQEPDMIFLS